MDLLVLYGQNPEDIATWDDLVDRAPIPDVYYRPAYLRAYALTGHGRPVAVLVRSASTEALFPLLIRKLDIDGQVVRDAVTPYGYGGLLRLSGPEQPGPEVARQLFKQLQDWLRASGLVACTMRFHPLLDQYARYGIGNIAEEWIKRFPRGQTTAIDLGRWDESQHMISGMRRDRRHDARRAMSSLQIRMAHGPNPGEDLSIFRTIYRQTMERLQADDFFFFADEYYDHLSRELGDRFLVINALAGGRPVASAIFLADSRFAHYHLAGCNDEGRRHGAATLLLMAACDWARQRACLHLHLGGGLQPDDSLWEFKRGFGGETYGYSYATLVADPEQYDVLTQYGTVWPYASLSSPAGSALLSDRPVIARGSELRGEGFEIPGRSSLVKPRRRRCVSRIAIYGAAGFGREVAPLAREMIANVMNAGVECEGVVFVSDVEAQIGRVINGIRVISYEDLLTEKHRDRQVVVALSDSVTRRSIVEKCERDGLEFGSIIAPTHRCYDDVRVGEGAIICDHTIFTPNIQIGRHFHFNIFSYVGHDCRIGDFVTFSPGVSCSGRIAIEDDVFVGAGVLLRPGTEEKHLVIGKGAVIGMGSIVTSDIPPGARVVGMGAVATRLSAAGRHLGGKSE